MGANYSKLKERQLEDSTSNSSSKSLIYKIHSNLYRNQSSQNSSEKINEYTSSPTGSFKKKSLFKRNAVEQDEEGSELCPVSSSEDLVSNVSSLKDDPMLAAATRLSARFDEEQSSSSQSPSETCIGSHFITSRLGNCCLKDDPCLIHTNIVQPNPAITVEHLKSSPPLESHNKTKDWLNNQPNMEKLELGVSSQNIVSNFFLRAGNESDQRKEKDRQQRLHYLLKRIWNGLYRAKLNKPKIIVNWCCGIGLWDMEMAALFPESQVIGVDFKEATLSNLQNVHPNLEFRHVVIYDHFTGLESFESNSVDYVMMRDVWFINAPVSKWKVVLEESFRILKPGGWIELSEHSLSIKSPGPCSKKLDTCFKAFFSEVGIDTDIENKLGGFLSRSGFIDIDEEAVAVPVGEWPSTNALKETGYLLKDWTARTMRGLSKWVCDMNNIDGSEMNQLITSSIDNEIDEYRSYINWTSYTARKPMDSSVLSYTENSTTLTPSSEATITI